ncbi:MAG TPA: chloride channel protein, partial [Acidimicrobiia bacterium]|nr:chloride channel protein [Acidimicrobiia bacterium]
MPVRRFILTAVVVGAMTGFAVAGFERLAVSVLFERVVSHAPLVLLACIPGVGLALTTWWLRSRQVSPATADEYLDAFHAGRALTLRDLVVRVVGGVLTLGSGCALGLEGPSIYVGSAIGSTAQRRFRALMSGADRNTLLVAGAAAGIAAIFKAPATGAVFALEVPYHDDLARRMLLPALVGAASGYL